MGAPDGYLGGDGDPPLGPQPRRIVHVAVAVTLALLVGFVFRDWLPPFHQPQRGGPEYDFRAGDLTPLFSVWTQVAARSIFERHDWPLWSDHIYCGEPFFAKPQIGVLSVTTVLCAVLPAQVVATWTFLLHLWIAGIAAYAWCLDAIRPATSNTARIDPRSASAADPVTLGTCLAAACGAVVFMLSGLMAEHAMMGHGPIVLVACWTPLVLRYLCRALTHDRPARDAVRCGLILAIQLLAGGETMFLYNAIAGALVGLAWLVAAPRAASGRWLPPLGRLVVVAAIVGLAGFCLSAVKVLPGLALMPLSNRAGGLSLEDARGEIVEFDEPAAFQFWASGLDAFGDVRHLFVFTTVSALIGLGSLWSCRRARWFGLSAAILVASGIAIAHSEIVFGLLWRFLPMFEYQRIPQRALVLSYLGLSVLVAAGVQRLLRGAGRHATERLHIILAGVVALAFVSVEAWFGLPPFPPTADIRREVRENQVLNDLARRPGEFRIHALESQDRNWGIEHVTVPLGLSNLAGWDHLWLRDYLGAEGAMGRDVRPFLSASYQALHPARFWGIMSVRYVTATRPIDLPGLRLEGRFPIAASSQPAKSAGPLLYANEQWQPRARVVPNAILVLGEPAERAEAVYALLDHGEFDPDRVAVIHEQSGTGPAPDTDLASYAALVLPERWAIVEQFRARAGAGTPVLTYSLRQIQGRRVPLWNDADAVADLWRRSAETDDDADRVESEVQKGIDVRREQNQLEVRLSPRAGFLVLADKFAHFPGWRCDSSAGRRELLRANSMVTAVRLEGTESWVRLTYWPPGLSPGLWLTGVSLPLILLLGWFGDRLIGRNSPSMRAQRLGSISDP